MTVDKTFSFDSNIIRQKVFGCIRCVFQNALRPKLMGFDLNSEKGKRSKMEKIGSLGFPGVIMRRPCSLEDRGRSA